jgi:hypothetical protein
MKSTSIRDAKGLWWSLSIDEEAAERIKADVGLDLAAMRAKTLTSADYAGIGAIVVDGQQLLTTVWAIVLPQASATKIWMTEFAARMIPVMLDVESTFMLAIEAYLGKGEVLREPRNRVAELQKQRKRNKK